VASNIKGITIEIGGDTVGLQNALSDVNKRSRDLQSELKQVERALKFNPGNVELLAQRQQLLTEQVQNTTERLNRLKEAQQQVEQQFQRGDIGADQYRAFQREIITTESRLNHFQNELRNINQGSAVNEVRTDLQHVDEAAGEAVDGIKELGNSLIEMAAGAAAGAGLGEVLKKSLEASELNTKIDIGFDVPEDSKKTIRDAVLGIQAYGVDGEAALEGVRKQWALNKTSSDDVNASVVKGAGVIAAAYSDIDFNELIDNTNKVASGLGITNMQALALQSSLLKAGFPPDQLDIIAEYGTQMKNAGYSVQQIQAIFEKGVNLKSWNIDNLLDGVKEGRIQLASFGAGVDDATAKLIQKTGISKKQFEDWGKSIAGGGEQGAKSMSDMVNWLNGIQDKTLQNQLATKVFGTMWEDQGPNMIGILQGVGDATDKSKQNIDGLKDATSKLDASPAVEMQNAINNMNTALQPVYTAIANIISKVAEWVAANPQLAATISAIAAGIGILIGFVAGLAGIIGILGAAAVALEIGMLPLTLIILGIAAAVAVAIAAGIAIYRNWDTIKAKASELWASIQSTWENIKNTVVTKAQEIWSSAVNKFNQIKDAIMSPIRTATSFISEQIEKIKGFFSGLHFELPKIKLPHFSLKGEFSLAPPKVPTLAVDWYKNGGVFAPNSPQLVGMGDANVPEAALPLSDSVLGKIAGMIAGHMSGGGNTYNFYPQKAIIDQKDIVRELQRMEALYG
jgi:phage-related minor tail protein